MGGREARHPLGLLLIALLLACTPYSSKVSKLQYELSAGRPDAALVALAELGDEDALPHLLDLGLLRYLDGDFAGSQLAFARAETVVRDLYTMSLSKEFLTLLVNDTSQPYRGELYERVWIHYYRALGYLAEGDLGEAAVEGRAITLDLQRYADKGEDEEKYRNDPFLQYFAGCLYEAYGDLDDAWINYSEALRLYSSGRAYGVAAPPAALVRDLIRTGRRLGFDERLASVLERYPDQEPPTLSADEGEVLLLVSSGMAPLKISEKIDFPIFKERESEQDPWEVAREAYTGWRSDSDREIDYILSIALPAVAKSAPLPSLRWRVDEVGGPLELGANLGALQQQCLEDRYGSVVIKTVARALVKYWAKKEIEEERGQVAGMIVDIFGSVTEMADTRSWSTLPSTVHVARLRLPAGTRSIQVGSGFNAVRGEVEVRPGTLSFLALRLY